MPAASTESWHRRPADVPGTLPPPINPISSRLRAHWPLKLLLYFSLTAAFYIPYLLLGTFPFRTPITFPLTPIDRAIPFNPQWVYIYNSIYLLIPIAPMLTNSRELLLKYTRTFLLLTTLGTIFYALLPVQCPRPTTIPNHPVYQTLVTIDPINNAFPSMHIAFVVQSLLLGNHLLRQHPTKLRWLLTIAATLWLTAIAYSTLATRQHYFIDLPAGALLALLCHAFIFRRRT